MPHSRRSLLSRASGIAAFWAGCWLLAHDIADSLIHAAITQAAEKEPPGSIGKFLISTEKSANSLRKIVSHAGLATRDDLAGVEAILERIDNLLQD